MKKRKNKICVYTCLTGNYDNLQEVELIEKEVDYLCFTNNKNLKSNTWKIIYIEDDVLDNQRLSRKIKMLGDSYISENYDISVWMDASVVFKRKVTDFVKKYLKDNSFAAFKHSVRDCIYEEAVMCCKKRKDSKEKILETIQFLEKEKYPKKNGLYEMTVFIKRHNDKKVIETMQLWFDMICKYSRRDQLSFMYCVWKTGLKIDTINLNVWSNEWFSTISHNYKEKLKGYRIYFGDDNEDFDYEKEEQSDFIINHNQYKIHTIIPKDTTNIIIEISDVPCMKYQNLKINSLDIKHIYYLNCTKFKENDVFYNHHGIIQLVGDFKKNEKFDLSIEMEKLSNIEIIEFIDYLATKGIESDSKNKKLEEDISIVKTEINDILNSKSWKITKPIRYFTSKMNNLKSSNLCEKIKKEILWYMPKSYAHKKIYKQKIGKDLNLSNPVDFNEKLQYLMIYKYGKKEGYLADKLAVKEYVMKKKIPNLYIPKTIKIYKNAKEIRLEELPDKFVLKCNHSSGNVMICNDKRHFDFNGAKEILEATRKKNFAKVWFEYHYNYIKPLIYAEEYLDQNASKNPLDFKIYCTKGKAQSILVCSERDIKLRLNEFDLEWNDLKLTKEEWRNPHSIPKPKNLSKMIKIAETLAQDLPFVRVDLYEINNKIYFGELTFSPAAGICDYYDEESLIEHGKLIDLNDYN